MTEYQLPVVWAVPAPTPGPSGEHIALQALWEEHCYVDILAMENRQREFARSMGRQIGASWASDPDFLVTAHRNGQPIQFGADVKGVTALRDRPLSFTTPDSSVRGLVSFAVAKHLWGVFLFVAWGGQDLRIATPMQVLAQGEFVPEWGSWRVDADGFPTLREWLDNFPPYDGGALARMRAPQPVLPPNVIQLPQAA